MVVWNMFLIFFHRSGIIHHPNWLVIHIFQRRGSTTNHWWILGGPSNALPSVWKVDKAFYTGDIENWSQGVDWGHGWIFLGHWCCGVYRWTSKKTPNTDEHRSTMLHFGGRNQPLPMTLEFMQLLLLEPFDLRKDAASLLKTYPDGALIIFNP